MKTKLVVGITGASGSIYAKVLLDKLSQLSNQLASVAIVFSDNARDVWQHELQNDDFAGYPFNYFDKGDFFAPFASGSSQYHAMVICPCSMGTLGRITAGLSNDLITRAADVMLKERRKLIAVIRETPLSLIHIKNMLSFTEAGGIVCPATPSFYSRPASFEDMALTVVNRVIDLAGLDGNGYRWGDEIQK